jgi:hypothetical protein
MEEHRKKYFLNYQKLHTGAVRPEDRDAIKIDIQADGQALLPHVGDYVSIDNSLDKDMPPGIDGRVKSRVFRYVADALLHD